MTGSDMETHGRKVSSYFSHQGGLGIINDSDIVTHRRKVSSYFSPGRAGNPEWFRYGNTWENG